MREILFRAYEKDVKRMLPVTSIVFNNNKIWIITVDNMGVNGDGVMYDSIYRYGYEVNDLDSLVLMQYTGLKDKNGVKIFEGDILKVESVDIDCNTANYFGGEVLFLQDIGLFAVDLGYDYLSFNTMKEATGYIYSYEVIGNIHDNSNIIK